MSARSYGSCIRLKIFCRRKRRERLGPDTHRPFLALLRENVFVVAFAHGDEQAIIVGVEELVTGALDAVVVAGGSFDRSEKLTLVVAVEMDLVCLAVSCVTLEKLTDNLRLAGDRAQCGNPIVVAH
jgi:hypothetical protein